jgi:hypothetical protein
MISKIMITNLTHGTKNGYYAGLTPPFYSPSFVGDNFQVSDYGIHTFSYFLSADFVGSVVIQASLVAEPSDTEWATLEDTRVTITTPGVETATAKTYVGHAVCIRVAITSFTAGTVIKIQHAT